MAFISSNENWTAPTLLAQHPGRGAEFRQINSVLHLPADLFPDFIHPIHDPIEIVEMQIGRKSREVTVSARDGKRLAGDEQARPNHLTRSDGPFEGHVNEFSGRDIPAGGEASFQRAPRIDVGFDGIING